MHSVYLDYNATAPLLPEAGQAMQEAWAMPRNASSVHGPGRAAKRGLETARAEIAERVNVFANEIIFTSSGTEANALALSGIQNRSLMVSAVEHVSVLNARADALTIPVDAEGIVRLDALQKLLESQPRHSALVSVMLANNETGVIQPVKEIARLAHEYGALVHTDAAQAIGRIEVDFQALGVDALSFCGHKFGGPVGAGVLALRQDIPLKPLLNGGRQELGRRAGTENIPAILGLAAALKQTQGERDQWRIRLDEMEMEILFIIPKAVVYGRNSARLPNTSCIALPGLKSETQIMALDLAGYAVSAGSACSSGKVSASHVLAAMGIDAEMAQSALRISIGWQTREEEVKNFTREWITYYQKRRSRNAA